MNHFLLFSICLCSLLIVSCSSHDPDQKKTIKEPILKIDSVFIDSSLTSPLPEHSFYIISKEKTMEWNLDSLSPEKLNIIMALNRIDYADVWRTDSLIAPENLSDELINYTPFPKNIQSIQSVRKLLIVSYKIQAFATYENGILTRWGPVSMGKKSTPTPVGLFHTNWKSKETISTIDSGWVLKWYFNFDNFEGVSLHEYELPGFPASHACIRLYPEDAYFFYYWAEQWILESDFKISAYGTPIIIFGEYSFGKRKPWLYLNDHPHYLDFSEEELTVLIQEHLMFILQRQTQRDSIPDL